MSQDLINYKEQGETKFLKRQRFRSGNTKVDSLTPISSTTLDSADDKFIFEASFNRDNYDVYYNPRKLSNVDRSCSTSKESPISTNFSPYDNKKAFNTTLKLKPKQRVLRNRNITIKLPKQNPVFDFDYFLDNNLYKPGKSANKQPLNGHYSIRTGVRNKSHLNSNLAIKSGHKKDNKKGQSQRLLSSTQSNKVDPSANKKIRANIFDIDNFVVSNLTSGRRIIEEKSQIDSIVIPNYKVLKPSYYKAPTFSIKKSGEEHQSSDEEDINDEAYLKYHNQYEQRELEYRYNINQKKKKAQTHENDKDKEYDKVDKEAPEATLIAYPNSLKFRIELMIGNFKNKDQL